MFAAHRGYCWFFLIKAPRDKAAGGPYVVCQSSSGFYCADPLSASTTYTVYTPAKGNGNAANKPAENVVNISGGMVDVTTSTCANQVCVRHKPINEVGKQIVCLPHGLVIELVAQKQNDARLEGERAPLPARAEQK